jgi:hypothetical protein
MKQHTTAHWQYGGVTNILSAFVRYSTVVRADEYRRAIE